MNAARPPQGARPLGKAARSDAPAEHTGAILVVRPSSLGDIVHALALVSDVAAHRPELAIDWVAEEAFVPLVALDPRIRRVIPLAFRRWRHHLLRTGTWREVAAMRRELNGERYAAILDLQEQVKGALVASAARGVAHGPDRASIREPVASLLHDVHHAIDPAQHLIDRCRQLAAAALGYRAEGPPRFGIVAPAPPEVAAVDRPYAMFVHATSRADKLWPEEHWRTLIAEFGRAGRTVLLPWGNADERARSERLARGEPHAIVPPRQSLPVLAGLLANADIVIGVDTGLVHLAAALGTPTIALFTMTDPALAGVARASADARDLGGNGRVSVVDEVRAAAGEVLRRAPRC